MKTGHGFAVFLLLTLWVLALGAEAAEGTPSHDGTTAAGSPGIVMKTTGGSCTAGGDCELGAYAGPEGSRPLDLEAFYSDYESLRSASAVDARAGNAGQQLRIAMQDEAKPSGKDWGEDDGSALAPANAVSDPLEPMNRAFFHFNDKLYFWFLKPAAQGYRAAVPETARVGVRNFFTNLTGPIRMVNCLLQGKGEEAGYEFVRLFMNTTVGLGGFLDVASDEGMKLERYDEDLGQTLGAYGWDHSIYINWPFLGPSCGRDTLGRIGDSFLDPVNYLVPRTKYNVGVKTYNRINETSLSIGDYEDIKRSALDPYVSIRDAYYQYRAKEIEE